MNPATTTAPVSRVPNTRLNFVYLGVRTLDPPPIRPANGKPVLEVAYHVYIAGRPLLVRTDLLACYPSFDWTTTAGATQLAFAILLHQLGIEKIERAKQLSNEFRDRVLCPFTGAPMWWLTNEAVNAFLQHCDRRDAYQVEQAALEQKAKAKKEKKK